MSVSLPVPGTKHPTPQLKGGEVSAARVSEVSGRHQGRSNLERGLAEEDIQLMVARKQSCGTVPERRDKGPDMDLRAIPP